MFLVCLYGGKDGSYIYLSGIRSNPAWRSKLQLRHKPNQEILFHSKILAVIRFIVSISK